MLFRSDWHAIHVDILHFQSYSHMYGVSSADSAIRETARILTESLKDINYQNAFLGHLGRDNFLVLCDSANLENIINHKNVSKMFQKVWFIIRTSGNRAYERRNPRVYSKSSAKYFCEE